MASRFWNQIKIQIEIRPKFTQICLLCITLFTQDLVHGKKGYTIDQKQKFGDIHAMVIAGDSPWLVTMCDLLGCQAQYSKALFGIPS